MKPEDIAISTLNRGDDYPFDAPNSFWNAPGKPSPPEPTDWAHRAARGVLADLTDRGGVEHGFGGLPEDIRAEMVQSLALIIRIARSDPPKEKELPPETELFKELQACRAAITALTHQLERQAQPSSLSITGEIMSVSLPNGSKKKSRRSTRK